VPFYSDLLNSSRVFDARLQWLGQDFQRQLTGAASSMGFCVLSDSTAAFGSPPYNQDWVYLFAQRLAAAYPAWTVMQENWDDTSQAMLANVTLQTGSAGLRSYRFDGTAKSLMIDAKAAAEAPQVLDVRMKVAMDDWTPASGSTLVAQYGSAGGRSWLWQINSSGNLLLIWSADGTNNVATSTSSIPTGFVDGTTNWVRFTFDPSGYSLKFYTSSDGATWVQLGTTVTGTATSLFNATTTPYEVGAYLGTNNRFLGNVYEVEIRSGLSGPLILPANLDFWHGYDATSPTPSGAPTIYFTNGSKSGAGIGPNATLPTYLNDAARCPKLVNDRGHMLVVLATSHTEGPYLGRDYNYLWQQWIQQVQLWAPNASIVVMTQNPEVTGSTSTASGIIWHARRRLQELQLASELGLASCDVFQGFLNTGNVSAYVQSDGIHPTVAGAPANGMALWRDYVWQGLFGP